MCTVSLLRVAATGAAGSCQDEQAHRDACRRSADNPNDDGERFATHACADHAYTGHNKDTQQ
jgi:hypothetical protein